MSDLNKKQFEAVETVNGPVVIIAGPGTGKTKTLVERTVNILVNKIWQNLFKISYCFFHCTVKSTSCSIDVSSAVEIFACKQIYIVITFGTQRHFYKIAFLNEDYCQLGVLNGKPIIYETVSISFLAVILL